MATRDAVGDNDAMISDDDGFDNDDDSDGRQMEKEG